MSLQDAPFYILGVKSFSTSHSYLNVFYFSDTEMYLQDVFLKLPYPTPTPNTFSNYFSCWIHVRKRKMFFIYHKCGTKKHQSSYEESNLAPWDSSPRCFTTESQRLYGERGALQTSCMTCTFHTARITDVDCAMFVNNRNVGKF